MNDYKADAKSSQKKKLASYKSMAEGDYSKSPLEPFGQNQVGGKADASKYARGGKVEGAEAKPKAGKPVRGMKHDDAKQDKALIAKEMKKAPAAVEKEAYAKGGKVKGKTNINIVIAAPSKDGAGQGPMPMMPPSAPAAMPSAPPRPIPPVMPPQGGAGAPPMMMGRKSGGRVPVEKFGSRSGEGRIEKSAEQKKMME